MQATSRKSAERPSDRTCVCEVNCRPVRGEDLVDGWHDEPGRAPA
jgi:hypothetical protein